MLPQAYKPALSFWSLNRGGRDQVLKTRRDEARNGKRDGIWDEKWDTRRNLRQEMGVNKKQEETRNIIFQWKTRKTGEKTPKHRLKENQKITRNTETRFQRDNGKRKRYFDEISRNVENGDENKNEVFSNVTIQWFKSKNKVLVQA